MKDRYLEFLPEPKDIQVVVLMGGLGSRLGEQTKNCPKVLVEVEGHPFFDYQLKILKGYGFHTFLFLVGYMGEMVEAYYGDGSRYGVEISYSYDEDSHKDGKLLGTGGALCKAYELLRDDFLLLYGDSFMDIDYRETIYRYFRGKLSGCRALMTVMENHNRLDSSNVVYEKGKIILYDKRNRNNRMDYIDYGVEMFEKTLFACNIEMEAGQLASDGAVPFDVAVLQNELSVEGKLAVHEVTNRFYEIGTPDSLEEFRQYAHRRFWQPGRAVFFDRDGVINEIVFHNGTEQLDSPFRREEVVLVDGVVQAMRMLQREGYYLFIVTNQPAAAKGKTVLADLYDVNTHICKVLGENGIYIDGVEICPHYPEDTVHVKEKFLVCDCQCRKPKTGMIDELAGRFSIDMEHSWMVGDSYTDILAGRRAGLNTAFLGNYKCDVCKRLGYGKPELLCSSVEDFACQIGGRAMGTEEYIKNYLCETEQIARQISQGEIIKAVEILKRVKKRDGRLFILGVGGSAANASHAVNDFRKLGGIEAYTPTDNVSELTARTNDEGWDTTFAQWLMTSKLREEDCLLVFSVGGGSETTSRNIVNALKLARERKVAIISIVSRDGGYSGKVSDACIRIPVLDKQRITPHAEGWQGIIWHLMVNVMLERV